MLASGNGGNGRHCDIYFVESNQLVARVTVIEMEALGRSELLPHISHPHIRTSTVSLVPRYWVNW